VRSENAWRTIAILSLALLHPAAQSEVVKVFGLPLGGPPAKPLKICPENFDDRTNLCWVDKPFVSKDGSRLGYVSMQEKDLPDWVAYKMIQMQLTPKGTIASLTAELRKDCDINKVASSVAARFGKPTEDHLQPQEILKTATWELKDIFIHMTLAGSHCSVSFRTPEDIAAQRAYWESKKVNRPATP